MPDLLNRLWPNAGFVMGEEVTVRLPDFVHEIHIGVYGHNEAQHREIQRLRGNAEELVGYLRHNNLLHALNHFFHDFWNAARVQEFVERMAEMFNVFEVRNGTLQREHNAFIAALLERFRGPGRPVSMVAGSDSHTLRRIGRSYTAAPPATAKSSSMILAPAAARFSVRIRTTCLWRRTSMAWSFVITQPCSPCTTASSLRSAARRSSS